MKDIPEDRTCKWIFILVIFIGITYFIFLLTMIENLVDMEVRIFPFLSKGNLSGSFHQPEITKQFCLRLTLLLCRLEFTTMDTWRWRWSKLLLIKLPVLSSRWNLYGSRWKILENPFRPPQWTVYLNSVPNYVECSSRISPPQLHNLNQ